MWIRDLRVKKGLKIYFTLDAGPNIHVISDIPTQEVFIEELKRQHPTLGYKKDRAGSGPIISCSKLVN